MRAQPRFNFIPISNQNLRFDDIDSFLKHIRVLLGRWDINRNKLLHGFVLLYMVNPCVEDSIAAMSIILLGYSISYA